MIEVQLAAGGTANYTSKFFGYRIIVPSASGSVRINNGVIRPMFGCDYFLARQGFDESGNKIWFPWQSVQVSAGPGAPVYVRVAESEEDVLALGQANLQPAFQEGDTIPPALGGVNPGPFGMVQLQRDAANPTKFIIPSAASTTGGGQLNVQLNNTNLSQAVVYDTTTGAGSPQDTGVIGLFNANSVTTWVASIVFSAVLTGSRALDVILQRADASQFSLFDPIRDAAPTIGIGRRNYFLGYGPGISSQPAGATGALDFLWGVITMVGVGGATGMRITVAAGGAETTRIIVVNKQGAIT